MLDKISTVNGGKEANNKNSGFPLLLVFEILTNFLVEIILRVG